MATMYAEWGGVLKFIQFTQFSSVMNITHRRSPIIRNDHIVNTPVEGKEMKLGF